MDSRSLGYSYSYNFSSVGLHEIISRKKFVALREEDRSFFFEMRTEFFILWRESEEEADPFGCEIIGSERYDIAPTRVVDGASGLAFVLSRRLKEYWMSEDAINSFCNSAIAFAGPVAAQHASIDRIPIVVHFEICTAQQEGESVEATGGRAIMRHKLFPLYLWPNQSVVRRPLPVELMTFLCCLPNTRVDSTETGSALMPICFICHRRPCIGDQITKLDQCACAFHHHCIVLKLETSNLCPVCDSQVYDGSLLEGIVYEHLFEDI